MCDVALVGTNAALATSPGNLAARHHSPAANCVCGRDNLSGRGCSPAVGAGPRGSTRRAVPASGNAACGGTRWRPVDIRYWSCGRGIQARHVRAESRCGRAPHSASLQLQFARVCATSPDSRRDDSVRTRMGSDCPRRALERLWQPAVVVGGAWLPTALVAGQFDGHACAGTAGSTAGGRPP
jgi:hypothetical protein